MAIELDDYVKEQLYNASVEKASSFINGGTELDAFNTQVADTAKNLYSVYASGSNLLLDQSIANIAMELSMNLINSVSTYTAEELTKALAQVLIPLSYQEIFGEAEKIMKDYIKKPDEIAKEVMQDNDQANKEDAEKKQKEIIDEEKARVEKEAEKIKAKMADVLKKTNEFINKFKSYISQGPEWAENQANYLDKKAKEEVDKLLKQYVNFSLKAKVKIIKSLAQDIAKRTANKINNENKKILKKEFENYFAMKEKVKILAKSKIAKATLNLMAAFGL